MSWSVTTKVVPKEEFPKAITEALADVTQGTPDPDNPGQYLQISETEKVAINFMLMYYGSKCEAPYLYGFANGHDLEPGQEYTYYNGACYGVQSCKELPEMNPRIVNGKEI